MTAKRQRSSYASAVDAKADADHDGYQPPTIQDIDSSEDREFAVVPGFPGSEQPSRN